MFRAVCCVPGAVGSLVVTGSVVVVQLLGWGGGLVMGDILLIPACLPRLLQDGLIHTSLKPAEILYLTVAYDWFLFG